MFGSMLPGHIVDGCCSQLQMRIIRTRHKASRLDVASSLINTQEHRKSWVFRRIVIISDMIGCCSQGQTKKTSESFEIRRVSASNMVTHNHMDVHKYHKYQTSYGSGEGCFSQWHGHPTSPWFCSLSGFPRLKIIQTHGCA